MANAVRGIGRSSATPAAGNSTARGRRSVAPSWAPDSTPVRLRRGAFALVLCTVALWGAMNLTLTGAHGAVSDASARAMPAVVDAAQAAYYLADADRVAAGSLLSGTVRLSGPGPRYQSDLKAAHQALEQAGEHDATGPAGSGQLQAVEGLLVEYTSLVEQAHANASHGALGAAYLSYASALLNRPDNGILALLQQLQSADQQAALQQGRNIWLAPGVLFAVLAPAAVALVLLVGTQRFLNRRFNRRLNPALLAGSVLLVALSAWAIAQSLHTDREYGSATAALQRFSTAWQARTLAAQASASDALALLLNDPAQPFSSGFTRYAEQLASAPPTTATLAAVRSGQPPQFHGILADLLTTASSPGGRDAAVNALQGFQRLSTADSELRQQFAHHDPGASATAVGPGGSQLGGAGAVIDDELSGLIGLAGQQLAAAQISARSQMGLNIGLPVMCIALCGLCLIGLWPRIDEYRTGR